MTGLPFPVGCRGPENPVIEHLPLRALLSPNPASQNRLVATIRAREGGKVKAKRYGWRLQNLTSKGCFPLYSIKVLQMGINLRGCPSF